MIAAARLAPIGRPLDRGDITDVYDEFTFAGQVGRVGDVPVLLDHDRAQQVGDVTRIWRRDGWWWAELYVDSHKHRLGCIGIDALTADPYHPVSLGCEVIHERQAGMLDGARWIRVARLEEVSLTRSPAYPAARVEIVVPTRRTRTAPSTTVAVTGDEAERIRRAKLAQNGVLCRNFGEVLRLR